MEIMFGKHNGDNDAYCWERPAGKVCKIGDYAIVESKDTIALVKIVGYGTVDDNFLWDGQRINKKVIMSIEAEEINSQRLNLPLRQRWNGNFYITKGVYEDICKRLEAKINRPKADCGEALQVEPKTGKWIPCSERLPSDDEYVIVSVLDDHGDTPWKYTTVAWLCNGVWISDNEILYDTAVAWMPLPKPYKGGDTE